MDPGRINKRPITLNRAGHYGVNIESGGRGDGLVEALGSRPGVFLSVTGIKCSNFIGFLITGIKCSNLISFLNSRVRESERERERGVKKEARREKRGKWREARSEKSEE